jgi:hypothetical protein
LYDTVKNISVTLKIRKISAKQVTLLFLKMQLLDARNNSASTENDAYSQNTKSG